jgi:tetratricopeptide (TPR) repeat protein/tRNA A-37 threonylcarbamoyl transferase component Bud32
VPEFPQQLKAALADRYVVEREIGSGGMATVYLAEDRRHHRKVAVKVLRPDLAAALGADRFLREIEIAAQLEHPHILTLIDSGEAEGFLYYIMPYVEGESLRTKLAREGELPIAEATRILHDVVDALAHAHSHGVVHRDIKPDNVLLSGKHAVVTDFGIAKAVSEATGRQQLTTAGVALGTPAYMAPEQAVADPNIDHRADVYAVGALAYELLAGRPPFAGDTAQQVLAAHVTEVPDPVTRYRDTVPPGMADLVMRCLAKKPADRWQRIEELLPQLEALTTPSGGITPTDTRPVEAAPALDLAVLIERVGVGRLMRVVGVYALASVAVLVAVGLMIARLGLPAWFLPAGVALLLVGLPIILMTAAFQTVRAGGAAAPTPSGGVPPWRAPHRWFTWRRAIFGGVFAFAGLGGLGLGVVWLRNRGHELHDDVVAVMPFHVVGRDVELWREGLVDLLGTALDGTGEYRSSDPRAVLNNWRRAVGDEAELPEPEKAAEVARGLGAGHLILGSVIRTGPQELRVAADLYSTRWLRKEGSATVEGSEDEMTDLVDRVTVELLKSVWRGEGQLDVRVSAVTTTSIPALRAYLEGEQAFRRSRFVEAQEAFTRAVEADSTFAGALHRLGLSYGWSLGIISAEVSTYRVAAVRHSGGLPERDSLLILGGKLYSVDGDPRAIRLLERMTQRYPDDLEVWYEFGEAYYHLGARLGRARSGAAEAFERAVALDSTFAPPLIHLIEIAHAQDDSIGAREWTARYLALDSTSEYATRFRIANPLRFGSGADSAAAVAALDTVDSDLLHQLLHSSASRWPLSSYMMVVAALSNPRVDDGTRGVALLHSAEEYLRRGRIETALDAVRRGHALAPNSWRPQFLVAQARVLGLATDSASRELLDRLDRSVLRDWETAVLAAHEGRLRDAQAVVDTLVAVADRALARGDSANGRSFRGLAWTVRGHMAAAADSVEAAIGHLRRGLPLINGNWGWPHDFERYTLATLLQQHGEEEEEALTIYGSLGGTPWLEAGGYLRRAQLHDRRGERDAALDYYGRFVNLWADADDHLQPQVEAAREAMARLAALEG